MRPVGLEAVLARLDIGSDVGDCWLYTGSPNGTRPYVSIGGKRYRPAYRVVYETVVSPVPKGMHLDHLCFRPRCVNPDHLEVVTPGENTRRGSWRNGRLNAQRAQTACLNGHAFDETNTYIDKRDRRHCRKCRAERQRQYDRRKRDVAKEMVR